MSDQVSVTLTPDLTVQDVRVLDTLPASAGTGVRLTEVIYDLHERERVRDLDAPLMTLRGLEHLGYVGQINGWWRRTPIGDAYLAGLNAPADVQEALL